MKIAAASLAAMAAALIAGNAAAAPQWPNWYVGVSGALNYIPDADIDGAATGEIESDPGYALGAQLGYTPHVENMFFRNTRWEAEFRMHQNGIDSATVGGVPVAAGGDIDTTAYMGNFYYDFVNQSRWVPFLGAGAGMANVQIDDAAAFGVTGSDDDDVFAWQLMAGLGYRPASLPMTEWTLGYRYFDVQDPEFSTAGGDFELDLQQHMLEAGAKFRF